MAKFIELKDAAEILKISTDELVEMRSRGEIHGYRDGASWKFRSEEIDRVIQERGMDIRGTVPADDYSPPGEDDEVADLVSMSDDADSDDELGSQSSILVSEEELGKSEEGTSSTVIGKGRTAEAGEDTPEGLLVSHDLTQEELAQLVGASRETVNKALADFSQRGWIHIEQRQVTLRDVPRLEQRAR